MQSLDKLNVVGTAGYEDVGGGKTEGATAVEVVAGGHLIQIADIALLEAEVVCLIGPELDFCQCRISSTWTISKKHDAEILVILTCALSQRELSIVGLISKYIGILHVSNKNPVV